MRLLQAFLRRYASNEARALLPWVWGPHLLDLGAGEGWVAEALRRRMPVWVCAADVGPFGLAADPYVVYDGARLPFGDGAFDTTLLSFVLHHTETSDVVLDEAVRVTRERLLVVESVYRDRLERFWLDLLDGRLNRYRHGAHEGAARVQAPGGVASALRVAGPAGRRHPVARLAARVARPSPDAVRREHRTDSALRRPGSV